MKEELLKIVVAEYKKMTGLSEVSEKACLPALHKTHLCERLTINYGFKVKKGANITTLNDFVIAIQNAFDTYEDIIRQVLEVANQICGKTYTSKQILFDEFSAEEACIFRYKLYQVIFGRHKLNFHGKSDELKTATDIAEFVFQQIN